MDFSADSIPNLVELTNNILSLVDFLDKPEIIELEKNDERIYFQSVIEKFDKVPMSIIRLMMERENRDINLEKLINLIQTLKSVKNGKKNINNAFEQYKSQLEEEYIYPKFGGKEEFEKQMKGQ
uniref:Uncharacterized protein n=1 Tax=viral metagenome TaxID=1070528 RepID=A0A6C0ECG1_9ZZZZ